jgi:hypothetical protein
MDPPNSVSPRKGRATPAEAKSEPVALAASGTAIASEVADIHRAKLGAAKRADLSHAKRANVSEAKQTSYAVAPATAALVHSAPTHALVRAQTAQDQNVRRTSPDRLECGPSKLAQIETLLRQEGGATIADLMTATGWQRHSVHGVLSGTFKTKRGLALTRTRAPDGTSTYAIKSQA